MSTFTDLYRSYRDKTGKMRSFYEAMRPLFSVLLLFTLMVVWALFSKGDILENQPRLFYWVTGTVFSNITVSGHFLITCSIWSLVNMQPLQLFTRYKSIYLGLQWFLNSLGMQSLPSLSYMLGRGLGVEGHLCPKVSLHEVCRSLVFVYHSHILAKDQWVYSILNSFQNLEDWQKLNILDLTLNSNKIKYCHMYQQLLKTRQESM